MSDHHKFRYLLPPGNNFAFVAKFKIWIAVSILLMMAAVGALFLNKARHGAYMNWTTDFKGGTEIHYSFKNKATHEYLTVDPAKVRDALAQWFAWHRRTQLPEYADQLVRAQREVLADTTPARVCDWQRELIKRAHTAYDRAEPAAAEIVLTISPAQIAHLEKRYTKFNEEFRDEYLQAEPARRAKKNLDRVLDRAEMLYGRLDDAQRSRIAEQLARSPFDPEVWLAERQQRQQDALRLLRSMGADGTMSREQAASALRGYVERLERSPRDAYRRYAERLGEFNCTLAANLHNATTPSQRRAAAKKLASWEGDLRAIAALGNR